MATVDITKASELIMNHGAKAVLLVWVFMLQMQVSEIRQDYKDCMNDRIIDSHRNNYSDLREVAILPKEIKIKKRTKGA